MAGAVCKEVYGETLRGVIVACRRYKDELLEACLELILSAPTTILSTHVSLHAAPRYFEPQHVALNKSMLCPRTGAVRINLCCHFLTSRTA